MLKSMFFTRLTPNENNWVKPSGKLNKCQGKNLFEASIKDYGHEEWLNSKADYFIYNGWRYGYVQAFSAKKHINKTYDLTFFTKRCFDNRAQLSIVGTGEGFIGIDENEARAFIIAQPNIIDIMIADLKEEKANYDLFKRLSEKSARNIINVKFRPESLNFYKSEKLI